MMQLGTGQLELLRLPLSHPEFTQRYQRDENARRLRDKVRATPPGGDDLGVEVTYEELQVIITCIDYYRSYASAQYTDNSVLFSLLMAQAVRAVVDYGNAVNNGAYDEPTETADEDDDYEDDDSNGCDCELCRNW